MIIGIMSDTHGHRGQMLRVARLMVRAFGAEWIYHAGDDYSDAIALDHAGYKVRAVPGLWCPEYNMIRIPRRIVDRIDGISIAMAHAEKDLTYVERAASVVVTGHTHTASVERIGGTVYLNPGHLKGEYDRGENASFAVLRTDDDSITITLYELDGAVRSELVVPRTELER
jgi:putative phosphoesterase